MAVEFIFWDVQHGHSTYVKTPNGKHIVVDLGVGSYTNRGGNFSPLLHLKNVWGVNQLDYVAITHPHLDHIDDILNFDSLSPKLFHRPNHITNDEIMKGVREQDRPKFEKYCEINNRYTEASTPDILSNPDEWGGLTIKTFHPRTCDKANFNNHSIVLVFEYLNTKVVVSGDNEACSLDTLLENNFFKEAIRNAEILLAPHHGRESGHHSDFLDTVNPLITIVSDGKYCDTSANQRYSTKSRGWDVYRKSTGKYEKRYCLTTNSDGVIKVSIDKSSNSNYKSMLSISI